LNKIAIIGSPGAGKSTFARHLGEITGIEVFHLDRLFWRPGWVETPRPEWIELQQRLVQNQEWIIDGNYGGTMDIRINDADTVVFLDFPRRVCVLRVAKRTIRYRGQTRSDMGEDCEEKLDFAFLRYIWNFPKRGHIKIVELLEQANRDGKTVIRLKTNEQVWGYLALVR
jgi:adenylate kinase family enzyme